MSELLGQSVEGLFMGAPIRLFDGTYQTNIDDREYNHPVHLAIHPNNSKKIIVNLPGTRGDIDGYEDKYKLLAHHIQTQGLAAVVRTGNDFDGLPQDINLNASLAYTKKHTLEICGALEPEIFLMGFSAGASAIAARAHEHPDVKRILLGAPARFMQSINVKEGLGKFTGEVVIIIGDNDDNVGTESGQTLYDWATSASRRELFVLPDCDHQFRGETNGRIISEAPFYAFGEGQKPNFPDPAGGIKLYY